MALLSTPNGITSTCGWQIPIHVATGIFRGQLDGRESRVAGAFISVHYGVTLRCQLQQALGRYRLKAFDRLERYQ
jgi:hypothetical protein